MSKTGDVFHEAYANTDDKVDVLREVMKRQRRKQKAMSEKTGYVPLKITIPPAKDDRGRDNYVVASMPVIESKSLIERLDCETLSKSEIISRFQEKLDKSVECIKELEGDKISLVETCQEWKTIYQLKCGENSRLSGIIEDVKNRCTTLSQLSIDEPKDFETKRIKIVSDNILDIINR